MLDWLSSKLVMTVAALLLLGIGVGTFALQRENAWQESLQQWANGVADLLDSVHRVSQEVQVGVRLEPGETGFFGERSFTVTILESSVVVESWGHVATSSFMAEVHLWPPSSTNLHVIDISALDSAHKSLVLSSGQTLVVERARLSLHGTMVTLVYSSEDFLEISLTS